MGFLNSGLNLARDLLIGDVSTPLSYYAWGAGSNAFVATDGALGSELFPSGTATQRNTIFSTREQPGQIILTGRIEGDQLIGGSIYEVGLATTISGGVVVTRIAGAKRLKTSSLEFVGDWYLTVKDI